MVHGTKSLTQMPNNFPQYRWEGVCLCGWATKNPTEELAKSQLNAHLQTNGVGVVEMPPEPVVVEGKPKGTWAPKGARTQDVDTGKSKSPVANSATDIKPTGVGTVDTSKITTDNPKPAIRPLGGGA